MISNIWSAERNLELVSKIAKKYKFSSRLKGSILAWDQARREIAQISSQGSAKTGDQLRPKLRRTFRRPDDLERGPTHGQADRPATSQGAVPFREPFDPEDLKMYGLLQKTYNYTTIDHGTDCELKLAPISECQANSMYSRLYRSQLAARATNFRRLGRA